MKIFTHDAGAQTMKRVAVAYKDGRVLETYNIDFANLDREPQDHWYFEQARENAITDNLVDRDRARQLSCRFADDLGEEKVSEHPAAQAPFFTPKGADWAATKRHDDTDPSRSEVPNLEQGRIARIAKITAWVAAITVAIGAIIAISIKLLLSVAGIPRDTP